RGRAPDRPDLPRARRGSVQPLARCAVEPVVAGSARAAARGVRLPHLELVPDHAEDDAAAVRGRQEGSGRGDYRRGARGCNRLLPRAGGGGEVGGFMKRSTQPIYWSLFGAGGMLAALIGPALVFITGIAAPAGVLPGLMSYPNALAFARNGLGKLFLFLV